MSSSFSHFLKKNAEHLLKIVISQPQNRHRRRRLTDVDDIDLPTSTMSILSLCSRVIGFDVEESHLLLSEWQSGKAPSWLRIPNMRNFIKETIVHKACEKHFFVSKCWDMNNK